MKIKEVAVNKLKKLNLLDWIIIASLILGGTVTYMADSMGLIDLSKNDNNKKNVEEQKNKEEKVVSGFKGDLIDGRLNTQYLIDKMLEQESFLEYRYESEFGPEYRVGWTRNPNRSDVTDMVRLVEPKFYGYRIVYKDDKFVAERSPLVDDIREIIDEYPFFEEKFYTFVSTEFRICKEDIASLTVDNIRNHIDAIKPVTEYELPRII